MGAVGRPRKYTPEELEAKINEYFDSCTRYFREEATAGKVVQIHTPRIPTIGEMCIHLDVHIDTLHQWENEEREFSEIIKRAKDYCTNKKIAALVNGEGGTTGIIFDLKANHGWKDKQTIEHEGAIDITLNLGE